jgi:hypothetical protein
MGRLCRWIETTHGVPAIWPNGPPKPAVNGQDPDGHNRNQQNWTIWADITAIAMLPNSVHWDPAYAAGEVSAVMEQVRPENITLLGGAGQVMADDGASGHHG